MAKRSRKYIKTAKKFDKTKTYPLKEGIQLAQRASYSNFTGSIELHTQMKIQKDKDAKSIKGSVALPSPIAKEVSIVVITTPDKEKEAIKAGATEAGLEKLIKKVKDGQVQFDIVLATPEAMPKIGILGKVLGPKGLMPSPKNGTVTNDLKETIKKYKSGLLNYRCDSGGNIHILVGKCDWDTDKIATNVEKALEEIAQMMHKPAHTLFRSIHLAPTMGLGFKIELPTI